MTSASGLVIGSCGRSMRGVEGGLSKRCRFADQQRGKGRGVFFFLLVFVGGTR